MPVDFNVLSPVSPRRTEGLTDIFFKNTSSRITPTRFPEATSAEIVSSAASLKDLEEFMARRAALMPFD
eukprot:CAMPEP_0169287024 /NCGR_PEP_ID=MMETSP1016-20121227/59654_1 /TAXON_ID=342587 /ORGANISM="Karlodinium micrum, Strain CCMP2283" /LENGTH=68 /DNA_ID=CAMNT_0009376857 /DNA_START=137 /DNA_END=340 /DNA_ORIENTATION=+